MMPYTKTYRVVVPIALDGRPPATVLGADDEHQDVTLARWLARESFEKTAAADALELTSYDERIIAPAEIDPRTIEALGRPATDFDWFEFSAVAELNQQLFDWCAAECLYNFEAYLAAEREWLAAHPEDRSEEDVSDASRV